MNTGEGDLKTTDEHATPGGEAAGEDGDAKANVSVEEILEEIEEVIDDGEENSSLVPRLRLTKGQKADIYEAFRLLDNVGNGLIDASKFRIALYALGYEVTPDELKSMIAAVGETPYGKLSLGDFFKLIMNKCVEKDCDSDLVKSFLCFDSYKIGEIFPQNMVKVAEKIDDDSNYEEIMEMFNAADDNNQGCLCIEDFMRMMNRCVSLKIEKDYE